jgi:cob(I)alamin adenosyltransferase
MKVYTRKGDDGTTGLLFGGRVAKDSALPTAYGTVDEAQAFLGMARAEAERGSELDELLTRLERELWVAMAELATDPANHGKLVPGQSRVTAEMVAGLEVTIDALSGRFEVPKEFVVPGQNRVAALLDVARTVVRRAERATLAVDLPADSSVLAYVNRLSDLLWTMARWQEGADVLRARSGDRQRADHPVEDRDEPAS